MSKKILSTIIFVFLAIVAEASVGSATMPPPSTQVQGCGQTLASLDTPIVANLVSGVTAYRFRVATIAPAGIPVQIVTNSLRTFKLTQLTNFAFARAYSIDVAVLHGGVWQPYGPACTIYSPTPVVTLQSSSCGLTLASVADPIYAQMVPFAQGYRFRVTNLLDQSDVHIIDRPLREFRLNSFDASSGATYLVEVAVRNYDGNYLPYGALCSVTCPILYTKIATSYCGKTLGALSDQIIANLVPGALGYRFKITNLTSPPTVQILDRPLRFFTMNMLAAVAYNTPYKVEVSVKDSSGNYLPYGPPCTIFTSSLPVPKIQLSQCELVGPAMNEMIYADEFPNATTYRFKLENLELGYSHYIDRNSRQYNLNMFPGLQPNTAYTVRVACKVDGFFTAYGKACDVTTPGATARLADDNNTKDTDTSEMPKLYPNPYSEYFSMNDLPSDAEVSVRIYDMTGRLLESHRTKGTTLSSLQMGRSFPTGVYNAVVTEAGNVRTYRIIKR